MSIIFDGHNDERSNFKRGMRIKINILSMKNLRVKKNVVKNIIKLSYSLLITNYTNRSYVLKCYKIKLNGNR